MIVARRRTQYPVCMSRVVEGRQPLGGIYDYQMNRVNSRSDNVHDVVMMMTAPRTLFGVFSIVIYAGLCD